MSEIFYEARKMEETVAIITKHKCSETESGFLKPVLEEGMKFNDTNGTVTYPYACDHCKQKVYLDEVTPTTRLVPVGEEYDIATHLPSQSRFR